MGKPQILDEISDLERQRLVDLMLARANALLAGKVGPVQTARSLVGFRGADQKLDNILNVLVVVDSDTDALPLGEVRGLWNSDALKRQDIEIAKADEFWRQTVHDACQELVNVLTPISEKLPD